MYRVLDSLLESGLVQRVDVGDGVARYEPVRTSEEHHHHLVCTGCGKVEAFTDPGLERAIHRVEETSGYAVDTHDVVLHGACADCRPAGLTPAAAERVLDERPRPAERLPLVPGTGVRTVANPCRRV